MVATYISSISFCVCYNRVVFDHIQLNWLPMLSVIAIDIVTNIYIYIYIYIYIF